MPLTKQSTLLTIYNMNNNRSEKIDFLVRTDGLLRDYILSVVIDSLKKELNEEEFTSVNPNHIQSALIIQKISPCSLKEFARTLRLSKSSASALINRMVSENIVQRDTNPENRREVLISLTPGFCSHVEKMHEKLLRWFEGLIDEIGEGAFEKWHTVMLQINETIMKRLTEENERF